MEEVKSLYRDEAMNGVGERIGGRALHPISMVVNGFTKLPSTEDLETLARSIEKVLPLARETARMISGLRTPDLPMDSVYFALRKDGEFALNDGRIVSSAGLDPDVHWPAAIRKTTSWEASVRSARS